MFQTSACLPDIDSSVLYVTIGTTSKRFIIRGTSTAASTPAKSKRVANVNQVGLRNVIDKKDVSKIYGVMGEGSSANSESQTWNRRYREYMDKLKTGSLYDVAEVYRDLSLLKNTKDLSFGERKLYDTAQVLLVKEISTAKNVSEETVQSELKALFPEPENPDN